MTFSHMMKKVHVAKRIGNTVLYIFFNSSVFQFMCDVPHT